MLRVVGEARRIESALKRLQARLKGVPAPGVRLTWRGGGLRTTLRWARDDAYWWAIDLRPGRLALLLGHAREAPRRRERITCEINIARGGDDRRLAGLIAADEAGTLYLAHSGRVAATRRGAGKASFRAFLDDGIWRPLRWPDDRETEGLVIGPLDSPRLGRLIGHFVDSVHRFKTGVTLPAQRPPRVGAPAGDCTRTACDRRLVDVALHEELAKRGLFGGERHLFTLSGARPQPLFAVVANGQPEELAMAVGSLSLATARQADSIRPILVAPAGLPTEEDTALQALPFACVRFRWRGARAVFDGLDDALA